MKKSRKKLKHVMGFPIVNPQRKKRQFLKDLDGILEPYVDPVAAAIAYGPIPGQGRKIW